MQTVVDIASVEAHRRYMGISAATRLSAPAGVNGPRPIGGAVGGAD